MDVLDLLDKLAKDIEKAVMKHDKVEISRLNYIYNYVRLALKNDEAQA